PWTAKKKGDAPRLGAIVGALLDLLEAVSVLVAPVMPEVSAEMRAQLGLPAIDWKSREPAWPSSLRRRADGLTVAKGAPIFPRFEKEVEAEIVRRFTPSDGQAATAPAPAAAASAAEAKAPEAKAPPTEAKATIAYDDF